MQYVLFYVCNTLFSVLSVLVGLLLACFRLSMVGNERKKNKREKRAKKKRERNERKKKTRERNERKRKKPKRNSEKKNKREKRQGKTKESFSP